MPLELARLYITALAKAAPLLARDHAAAAAPARARARGAVRAAAATARSLAPALDGACDSCARCARRAVQGGGRRGRREVALDAAFVLLACPSLGGSSRAA